MQFIVYALDRPGTGEARLQHRDAHRARLRDNPMIVVSAGPLFADDGETPIGSIFVLQAETLDAAKAFMAEDPFVTNAIYHPLAIHPFTWTIRTPSA